MKYQYWVSGMSREEALDVMRFVEEYPKTERWARDIVTFELISTPDDPDAWIEARFVNLPGYIFMIYNKEMARYAFAFAVTMLPESERFSTV